MKMIAILLLSLSFTAFAGGPYWEGEVTDYKIKQMNRTESILQARINGSTVETNSKMIAILVSHATTVDLPIRVSNYRLDVRDITKTGVLAGSATLKLENGDMLKVTTTANELKRVTSEKMELLRSGVVIKSAQSHLLAMEILTNSVLNSRK